MLDLQPGRSNFLTQARHFGGRCAKPWVGLALDPEWRMGPHQVPAQQIGHVGAAEVNHVSRLVAGVVRSNHLPQKIFMVHQFRTRDGRNIAERPGPAGLAMVQHVDGFGTRRQKLATYHGSPSRGSSTMGFKLFYDEDIHRVHALGRCCGSGRGSVRQLPVTDPRRRTLSHRGQESQDAETSGRRRLTGPERRRGRVEPMQHDSRRTRRRAGRRSTLTTSAPRVPLECPPGRGVFLWPMAPTGPRMSRRR